MPDKIVLQLPFPPTVNHVWKHACRNGRLRNYMTDKGKAYRNEAILCITRQQAKNKQLTDRLDVTIELHAPDNKRRDIDNHAKSVLDALTIAGTWQDDEQVDKLTLVRMPPTTRDKACAIVVIKTIPEITDD
mgnify:CR=1 FL=1